MRFGGLKLPVRADEQPGVNITEFSRMVGAKKSSANVTRMEEEVVHLRMCQEVQKMNSPKKKKKA